MDKDETFDDNGDVGGLCLLSLDGGGVRGLSSLYILKNIMDQFNGERRRNDSMPPIKPCQVFDLIGGTSTGGLIAIMLGHLEMDVDECITAYNDLAAAVFQEKTSRLPIDLLGRVKARFDSAKLEVAVQKVVAESGTSTTHLFNDGIERACRTFVCTIDQETKDIIHLRDYSLSNESNIRATISQAAMATSAATTFFDPVKIGDRIFADGGFGTNNPVEEVEGEATKTWCQTTGDLKPLVSCLVSIGTGNPGIKPFESSAVKFLARTLKEIATETQNTERRFSARWGSHLERKRYFRFNVDQGLQNIGLDEYKKKGTMEAATESYLSHTEQKIRVRDCTQSLRKRQKKSAPSPLPSVRDSLVTAQIYPLLSCAPQEHGGIPIRQRDAARTVPFILPFDRNRNFTGQESQLAHLLETLFAEDHSTKLSIAGLGGIGKTQLALELAYRVRAEHKDCAVIWIPATNAESLIKGYRDVAQQIGIPGSEDKQADFKRLVQGYLSRDSAVPWLLIFDNADNIEMWTTQPTSGQGSDRLLDYLPRSQKGRIVFTTRDRKAAYDLAPQNVMELKEMDDSVATQLLQKHLPHEKLVDNVQDTKELLAQLTLLPLALVQAAAYINKNGITIADYVSLLRDQEEDVVDLLSEDFEDDGRYHSGKNPVVTTWLISFERMRERDPLAADLLSFMACVDSKNVPLSLLPPSSSRKRDSDAIGTLDAYSFVKRRRADQALDVHRLVHLSTRNWLRKEGILTLWTGRAFTRLGELLVKGDYGDNIEVRRRARLYLPHAHSALETDLDDENEGSRLDLVRELGYCLYFDGRYDEAELLFKQALETTRKVFGVNHAVPNSVESFLAGIYLRQGRLKEAEELYVPLVKQSTILFGAEGIQTLHDMNSLSYTYMDQNQYEKAEELCTSVMKIAGKVYGTDSAAALDAMKILARVYLKQDRLDEAVRLQERALQTARRVYGEEDRKTLACMHNMALIYLHQNRLREAAELQHTTVEASIRVRGAEYPDTVTSMHDLAGIYCAQGRTNEAEAWESKVLEFRERVLGLWNPQTMKSMTRLADIYNRLGRYQEAIDLLHKSASLQSEFLGDDHLDTLYTRGRLSDIQQKFKNLQSEDSGIGQEPI